MQLEALIHPFFDELRDPNSRLPNGRALPPLFNFKAHGILTFPFPPTSLYISFLVANAFFCYGPELKGVHTETLARLVPEHARKQCAFLGS